jgi:hypothetical protein
MVALYYNSKTQKQYKKSIEPQLSMQGKEHNGWLYLLIQNTGRTAASDIKIIVKSIENNHSNDLQLDNLFSQSYDLYPNETIQGRVAVSAENISTGNLYPKITIDVSYSYKYGNSKKRIKKFNFMKQSTDYKYTRTVTFSKAYDAKVFADVSMNLKEIESSLKSTARSTLRTANYLDGEQVRIIDELDILAGKSLKNDIISAIESPKKDIIESRTKCIEESFLKKQI